MKHKIEIIMLLQSLLCLFFVGSSWAHLFDCLNSPKTNLCQSKYFNLPKFVDKNFFKNETKLGKKYSN